MLADIGLIGGVYTFVRLLLLFETTPAGERVPAWKVIVIGVALLAIGILTLDILLQSTVTLNDLN